MIQLPSSLRPKFQNENFFPDYPNPSAINMGHCYDWAFVAFCLYPQVILWSTPYGHHAWVQVADRFYDSETKLGRKAWWRLPFFKQITVNSYLKNNDQYAKPMVLSEFKDTWNKVGRGWHEPNMWNDMIKRITNTGLVPLRTQ